MLSFKDNFFFVKFSILFFIVTIFGYWGLDLNSEELYIAFSFFFLVIVAFGAVRTSMLLFFLTTVNKKYLRLLVDLNRIRLILFVRSGSLRTFLTIVSSRKAKMLKFLEFSSTHLISLVVLKSRMYLVEANKFFLTLSVHLNFFVLNNARSRRFIGFFENSSRFFSVNV